MASRAGFSRRTLLQTIALSALAGCAGGAGAGSGLSLTSSGIVPPVAPRIPFPIEQLGRTRNDYYRWMKYIPETGTREMATLPEMIRAHLEAEAAYAEAVLAPARRLQPEITAQMLARVPGNDAPPVIPSGPWAYASHYPEGSAHAVYTRALLADPGAAEVLLDEAGRAAGAAYYRTTGHQPSPDHRYYAWAEDVIGNDRHRICVKDTQTGATSVLVGEDAYGYGGLVFSPSSRFLFWI